MSGKGSKQRPTNMLKFSENYDKIFNSKTRKNTPSHAKTVAHVDKKKEAKKRGDLN
jgi:hypothetical protein